MALTLAFELKVEKKPTLPHLAPTTIGTDVKLNMTSIVISAIVTIDARQLALLDGAQLGFVQSGWVHRYWSRYEGPNVADGSALIDEVAPDAYNRIVYTDTVERGQLFYAPPGQPSTQGISAADRGDYGALASTPSSVVIDGLKRKSTTVKLVIGDKTVSPVLSTVPNDITGKQNILAELYVQQEFYTGLVIRERSGAASCLGFVHWWNSYHYKEQWYEPITAATNITHVAVPADTYIRVGTPTKGPPKEPAFHRALVVPSPMSMTEAGEISTWSAKSFDSRDAPDHIPRPTPFGVFN